MDLKTIVLPVDFSHSSDAALSFASKLASESNALLYIVHVGEDSPAYLAAYGGFAYTPDLSEKIAKENQDLLGRIKPVVTGVNYQHKYLTGVPETEILEFAARENADLIVIGSHGRTGLSRLLLGSVAEAVVRRAKCPVLTVKQPTVEKVQAKAETQPGELSSQPI